MSYRKGFDFDQASLGRNLAVFDHKVKDFIERDLDEHTRQGQATMKSDAPWRNRTWHARNTLWANNHSTGSGYRINMGHGAEYGIYLEESNQGRFQIVKPVLEATAVSFMQSLERMFLQLETRTPPVTRINPGTTTRPNTTRPEVIRSTDRTGVQRVRDSAGRFISKGDAKRLAKNAAARARYAVDKASGTMPTRKSRRG